jgi:hypothetical protein
MASGILGQAALAAITNTTVYTVPTAKTATFNVVVTNRDASAASIQIALTASGTPTTSEYIEYNTVVPGFGVFEKTGVVAQAAKNLVAYATTANLTVNVYGYEE